LPLQGIYQVFLQEGIQLIFVLPRIFLLFIYDEGWIPVHPISDGFEYSLERLDVNDFDQDFLTVSLG